MKSTPTSYFVKPYLNQLDYAKMRPDSGQIYWEKRFNSSVSPGFLLLELSDTSDL